MNSARISALAALLNEADIDAYIAQSQNTLGYLADFPEDSHERFLAFIVTKSGQSTLICPALSAVQAARCGIEHILPWKDGEDPLALFFDFADAHGLRRGIVAIDDTMPARQLLDMQNRVPSALYKSGSEVLSELMRSKDEDELTLLRRAAKIADEAFEATVKQIRVGLTEIEIAETLNSEMNARGGKPAFAIVAVGENAAEPHHLNDETRVVDGQIILMDFGCSVGGYFSDITRTVCMGLATDEMKSVYKIVYDAHMAARSVNPNQVTGAIIDSQSRGVIEASGYGEFFTHRTGHGIGSQIHEAPYISAANTDLLKPGDCFSIEPGIYLSGKFGVRIENIVTLNQNGLDSLNAEPSPILMEI
jgi:Xaa-Pro dipeptidase